MIFSGVKNIKQRARELCDRFQDLNRDEKILSSIEKFNSETEIDITKKSLVLNKRKNCLVVNAAKSESWKPATWTATRTGAIGYVNPEIQKIKEPQPKRGKSLFVIPEVNEDQGNERDLF